MLTILLQQQAQQSSWFSFVFFGAIILIFYFFMIRPQQKKAKDQKKFIEEIKKGDYVVTIGGAHGYVAELKGGRIRFNKSAISQDQTKIAAKK
jgi:preprotein translocase subunit YajC